MEIRILCVHGVGSHPTGGPWEGEWKNSIVDSLLELDGKVAPVIEFVYLDDIFERYPITALDVLEAFAKLAKSGATSIFRQPKGIGDQLRWTAGMVVQWVENHKLRDETRQRLETRLAEFKPDIVCAHSLGSLVCYDSFSGNGASLIKGRCFVSCGSQIGNPFVIGNFAAGRLSGLPEAKFWYHLYNTEDDVFTAKIKLSDANFAQIETYFDIPGPVDHDVRQYMRHGRTSATVWSDALMALHGNSLPRVRSTVVPASSKTDLTKWATNTNKRALLVGINHYPNSEQNLEGCVNDVFLMSAVLQESGFAAEDIRIVLNDRATHQGVCERLEWLLGDAKEGDIRFFYYSGHGAQLPTYGIGDRIDRLDETLVLHDFDWTRERAFTDDDFYGLYSQLPYNLQFITVFDCCHSGGMTRGPVSKVRGIDPPDDIRHRMLRWDSKREMWVERKIESTNPGFERKFNPDARQKAPRFTHRLGQAMDLRSGTPADMDRKALERGHKGPYLPILIYASREEEFSFEYQHGPISYGAFTYCLAKALRRDRLLKRPRLTFASLISEVRKELAELGYEQQPKLIAPTRIKTMKIPLSVG